MFSNKNTGKINIKIFQLFLIFFYIYFFFLSTNFYTHFFFLAAVVFVQNVHSNSYTYVLASCYIYTNGRHTYSINVYSILFFLFNKKPNVHGNRYIQYNTNFINVFFFLSIQQMYIYMWACYFIFYTIFKKLFKIIITISYYNGETVIIITFLSTYTHISINNTARSVFLVQTFRKQYIY